jgi:hypothetical protein
MATPYESQDIFSELKPYAHLTVVPGVTIGDLNYVTHQHLYSTAAFNIGGAAVPADLNQPLFAAGENEQGQGFASALTRDLTNFTGTRGELPANQAFVATRCGFSIYRAGDADPASGLTIGHINTPDDMFAIAKQFYWTLSIGRGPVREIGTLDQWPQGDGTYSISSMGLAGLGAGAVGPTRASLFSGTQNGAPSCGTKVLNIPIVFPPMVSTAINVRNGVGFTLQNNPSYLLIRCDLYGYQFTMPV